MASGRFQTLATFGDWHTVVGEVPWSLVAKTTMDCHSKLVLHSLRNDQPVQVVMHQPKQTTLVFPGLCDQTCCSILNDEHAATCPWPSSARKTKQSYNSRGAMWQRRGLICSASDEHVSAAEARKKTCLADIWNMPVNIKKRSAEIVTPRSRT